MQAVKKDGVPVVLMSNLAVGNTYTIIIYVQYGKLEGSEISEKSSEKEVESVQAVENDKVPRGAIPVGLMRHFAVGNTCTITIYFQGGRLEGSEISEKSSEKEVESAQPLKKDGVPRGCILVGLMRHFAVGNTYTIIIHFHGGKLEGSEIRERSSEKVVESVQPVKNDGVPRGCIPVGRMRHFALGNTYMMRIYVQGGKLEGSEISVKSSEKEVKSVLSRRISLRMTVS